MTRNALTERLESLLQPTIRGMGYHLVRVQVIGQHRPRLQVMAERDDGVAMQVDDCAELSRAISAVLDVDDPITGSYTLEVSSPGIDRPLVRLADFDRFAGFEVRVETDRLIDGRRRFIGRLLGAEGEHVRIAMNDQEAVLPYADIRKAKLVLTDALLAAHRPDASRPGASDKEETNT
ncbi:MAG: ribosome maturation factor RimP [Rhodospirillales bacterium]|nr:MAG: ribosome maturation factor RimP [Rhodospirillales bacterium]